jgi:hypothetical protein
LFMGKGWRSQELNIPDRNAKERDFQAGRKPTSDPPFWDL